MIRTAFVAVMLLAPSGIMWAGQGNPSPDTQQEKNGQNGPPSKANAPGTGSTSTANAQSPDQQQGAAGEEDKGKGRHGRSRNNARQAHGTPKPATGTDTAK